MAAALLDRSLIDDRDYYGNKRLELAGGRLRVCFVWLCVCVCVCVFPGAVCVSGRTEGTDNSLRAPSTPGT